jgi:hypothetical protein
MWPSALYTAWLNSINKSFNTVKEIRNHKWDEDIELDDEDLDLDTTIAQLKEEDPEALEAELTATLKQAFDEVEQSVSSLVRGISGSRNAADNSGTDFSSHNMCTQY